VGTQRAIGVSKWQNRTGQGQGVGVELAKQESIGKNRGTCVNPNWIPVEKLEVGGKKSRRAGGK